MSALIEVTADGQFKVLKVEDGDQIYLDPKDGIVHFRPRMDSGPDGGVKSDTSYGDDPLPEATDGVRRLAE